MSPKSTNKYKFPKDWDLPTFEIHEFSPKKTKYCVGIPIINEGEKIIKQLKRMKKLSKIIDIVIFDGGSTDGSTNHKFLKSVGVNTLLVKTSPGKQGTQLRMGFAWALKRGYEGIVTVDGNGKDDTNAIPNFIKELESKYDFIQGSRFISGGKHVNTPMDRLLGVRLLISPVLSLGSGYWFTDTTNGFRGYSKKYLLHPEVKPFRNIFVTYNLIFYLTTRAKILGLRVKEIPVVRSYPSEGKIPTKITGLKVLELILTAFKAALGFYKPN